MKKPISTRTHGIIDYGWAAAATALAKRADDAPATARLLRSAASLATATSAMTNYEYGAIRLLPMRGHLAFDFALCSALMVAPLFLPESERRHALAPAALGVDPRGAFSDFACSRHRDDPRHQRERSVVGFGRKRPAAGNACCREGIWSCARRFR